MIWVLQRKFKPLRAFLGHLIQTQLPPKSVPTNKKLASLANLTLSKKIQSMMKRNLSENIDEFTMQEKANLKMMHEPPNALKNKFLGNRSLKIVRTPQRSKFHRENTNISFSNKETEPGIRLYAGFGR